jgi:hypothetical protein
MLEIIKTDNTKFDWSLADKNGRSRDTYGFVFAATTISELYKIAFNTTIYDAYDLDSIRYDIAYIKKSIDKLNPAKAEQLIRLSLGLKKDTFQREITTYTAKIKDRSKLTTTLTKGITTMSSSGGVFIFKNVTIEEMLKNLGDEMRTRLYSLDRDKGKYDFNISIESPKTMLESLRSYGFQTTDKKTMINAIRLVKVEGLQPE